MSIFSVVETIGIEGEGIVKIRTFAGCSFEFCPFVFGRTIGIVRLSFVLVRYLDR
jgi:hypothetical protein